LAEKMRITEGRFVTVDNRDGKFNITHSVHTVTRRNANDDRPA